MSSLERLFIKRIRNSEGDVEEELRVCMVRHLEPNDPGDKPVPTATPHAADIAYVLTHASSEWFSEFLGALRSMSGDHARAFELAAHLVGFEMPRMVRPVWEHTVALHQGKSGHCGYCACTCGETWPMGDMKKLREHWQAGHLDKVWQPPRPNVESNLPAFEPGDFGYDPEDSKRLLDLRTAIDVHLGWRSHISEEAGDYEARVREVGEALNKIHSIWRPHP